MVLSMVVIMNSIMGKLVMENALADHLSAVVELGVGEYYISNAHLMNKKKLLF